MKGNFFLIHFSKKTIQIWAFKMYLTAGYVTHNVTSSEMSTQRSCFIIGF